MVLTVNSASVAVLFRELCMSDECEHDIIDIMRQIRFFV